MKVVNLTNPLAGNLRGVRFWSRSPPLPAALKNDFRSIFVFNGTIDSTIYVQVSYTRQFSIGYNFLRKDVVVPAVEINGTGNWEQVRFRKKQTLHYQIT